MDEFVFKVAHNVFGQLRQSVQEALDVRPQFALIVGQARCVDSGVDVVVEILVRVQFGRSPRQVEHLNPVSRPGSQALMAVPVCAGILARFIRLYLPN